MRRNRTAGSTVLPTAYSWATVKHAAVVRRPATSKVPAARSKITLFLFSGWPEGGRRRAIHSAIGKTRNVVTSGPCQVWPMLVGVGSMLADSGPMLVDPGPIGVEFGRLGPNSVSFGLSGANSGPIRGFSRHMWPTLGRCGPVPGHVRWIPGQGWSKLAGSAQIRPDPTQDSSLPGNGKIGRHLSIWGQHSQILGHVGRCGADWGRIWPARAKFVRVRANWGQVRANFGSWPMSGHMRSTSGQICGWVSERAIVGSSLSEYRDRWGQSDPSRCQH